jgi:acyl-CoA synthetase (AMP-forming)/AMP-acid ligase II
VLDRRAANFLDRVMTSIAGARGSTQVTFEQMRQRSWAAANSLLDLGIRLGDCVALFAAGLCIERHPQWFRTRDLGVLDSDQNLTYADRVKDSLRRCGENISSVGVETAVMGHPAVLEAAVVGSMPSELGEDGILLIVTLRPDAALDYTELLDFCSVRMPYFCVPRYVEIVNEIPKQLSGGYAKIFFASGRRARHLVPRKPRIHR